MTDNEIKKALEICGAYKGKCTDCPAFMKVDRSNCKKVLLGALDIINRQEAEIEKKDRAFEELIKVARLWKEKYNTAKAEVERLKKALKVQGERLVGERGQKYEQIDIIIKLKDQLITTKAEAYKEFAERLKEKKAVYNADDFYWVKYIPIRAIDNLLNELVGEQ